MASTIEEIARAFSGHQFAEVYPHMAANVEWDLIGASPLRGQDAVIEACEQSLDQLAETTTDFARFRAVVGSDAVVIDSLATYTDANGEKSVVASCDIYDFAGGELIKITSYTLEVV